MDSMKIFKDQFNERCQELRDAICDSSLPIILGIGHAKDTFQFDNCESVIKEAETPSMAAQYLNESFDKRFAEINRIVGIAKPKCLEFIKNSIDIV